jgi:hypothetical protein
MVKIIVEGDDDRKFIEKFFKHLEIDKFEVEKMGGKSNLLDFEKYKKLSSQKGLKFDKVLFLFDSDFEKDDKKCGGLVNSTKCIENLIKELNWEIKIDYYIFDKNLDYFLLETIKDCKNEFDNFINCIDIVQLKPNKKPIANLYRDLYPKEPFDFSHKNFDILKQKIINLCKG